MAHLATLVEVTLEVKKCEAELPGRSNEERISLEKKRSNSRVPRRWVLFYAPKLKMAKIKGCLGQKEASDQKVA